MLLVKIISVYINMRPLQLILVLFLFICIILSSIIPQNHEPFDQTQHRVCVFYHIYCNEHTMEVLKDQINKIVWSGLYKNADHIYCFVCGQDKYVKQCSEYIEKCGKKFTIEAVGIDDATYERFTLLKIKNLLQANDKFLYIHTKGITKKNTHMANNIEDWRYIMEYFLISNWMECTELLNKYDTVGINQLTQNNDFKGHYSGNFWWSTAEYFNKLPDTIDDYYTAPEDYIFLANPSAKNIHSTGLAGHGHYDNPYPLNRYVDA